MLRRLVNYGQLIQSHALSFFHLSSPDLLLGMDLVDTLSAGAGRFLEQGNVTVNRIEVRAFDAPLD